ncbi:MAG: hypothetical protein GX667_06125 [Xanthomonadaceae bacterium]|nr:hypothetical protein [Xanthomonadaceae bacterium]
MRILEQNRPEESDEEDETIIEIEGLKINNDQFRATFESTNLNLTSTEFSLLYYMAQHRGETVSRDELSREVLGKRHQAFDRVIDMHLSNIRKKLPDRPSGIAWFKTVHGQGYLFLDN